MIKNTINSEEINNICKKRPGGRPRIDPYKKVRGA